MKQLKRETVISSDAVGKSHWGKGNSDQSQRVLRFLIALNSEIKNLRTQMQAPA
jgi:hypothetical protein